MSRIKNLNKKQSETLEKARSIWSDVAKKSGWYKEPFFVQVWLHKDGSIDDCVSFQGLTEDIILPAREINEKEW